MDALAILSPLLSDPFVVSTGLIALGEIGDKTQLLALVLSARFRKPAPIIAGIAVATIANHALAGALGDWLRAALPAAALKWLLGLSFLAFAVWALVPDKLDAREHAARSALGVFAVTTWVFFVAEMGDKTQLATMMLAARFGDFVAVVAGTTLGMLIADVPAVLVGARAAPKVPMQWIRAGAAGVFVALGVGVLVS